MTWQSTLASSVASSVENLSPGAFAFVMATGIVSSALAAGGHAAASTVLLLTAVVGYAVLAAAYALRLVFWRRRFLSDLAGPGGFAFLTFVAASNVLASRLVTDHRAGAAVLLGVGVAGWLVLGYGVPVLLIATGRTALDQVNGTWFMWVVGTQSVALAALSLAPYTSARMLAGFASVCWAVGLVQYLLTAALALARLLLGPLTPRELIPPYWIFMGAAAISVLAGAKILELPQGERLLPHAFTLGLSMVLWSFCTWLIPLLLTLGVWRHLLHRVPLWYETSLWSFVFPVGMYGVATRELGRAAGVGWLTAVGADEGRAAAVIWALVFLAMLSALVAVPVRAALRTARTQQNGRTGRPW